MKIAQVVCVLPPYGGGLGSVAHYYASGLSELGQDVAVFVPKSNYDVASQKNYQVRELSPLIRIGLGAIVPQLYWRLKNFDLVHFHQPFLGATWPIVFLKLIKGKKLKLVVSYQQDLTLKGWRHLYYWLGTKTVLPLLLRLADKIVVSSLDYVGGSIINDYYLAHQEKFAEIPFGARDDFRPRPKDPQLLNQYGFDPDDKIILFVGGLDSAHYFKGVDLLIEAISGIEDQKVKALIVGKGDLQKRYEKLAVDRGVAARVKFAGYVSDADLPAHYNLAEVFTLPSRNKAEAFGIVLVEAMASGVPLVATDLRGVRTVVRDGINGLIARPGDADDLRRKLVRILSDSDLAQELRRQGISLAEESYRWPKIIEKLNDLYLTLF